MKGSLIKLDYMIIIDKMMVSYLFASPFSMSMRECLILVLLSSVLQEVVRLLIAWVIVRSISLLSSPLPGAGAGRGAGPAESAAMVARMSWPTVITGMLRSSSGRENCSRSGTTSTAAVAVDWITVSYGLGSLSDST